MVQAPNAPMDMINSCYRRLECRAMEIDLVQTSAILVEQRNEIEKLNRSIVYREIEYNLLSKRFVEYEEMRNVIFSLAMIDRDAMTEHDEALLEEAIEKAKSIYNSNQPT